MAGSLSEDNIPTLDDPRPTTMAMMERGKRDRLYLATHRTCERCQERRSEYPQHIGLSNRRIALCRTCHDAYHERG